MAPRETENNAYAKFWGDKQRTLWYVMVFLEWSIVPSLARILTKQHGIRGGGEYLLKTPENAISETLNFKMSLDATVLKNLCLGASSKAAYYS